jgi:hypothetical protein
MSGWVRSSDARPASETRALLGAWQILACRTGYSCDPSADFRLAACVGRPDCYIGENYNEYFEYLLGSDYDEAVRLAGQIQQAVAARDVPAILSYL